MYKLDLEKAEEPEIKLPAYVRLQRKQENSRKISTSASFTMNKPLTVWITINCDKFFFKNINLFKSEANYFTILYWFCHTSTLIRHRCTHVPHLETLSHLPPHIIPLGHPSAPALSILYHASNLDWFQPGIHFTYDIIHVSMPFSQIIPPLPLPQSPKDCSIHLCLFCCLAYRVIIIIFLIPYICVSILYWCFSFWLTSLCIIGSSFIHLIRTDSNVFFLMAE